MTAALEQVFTEDGLSISRQRFMDSIMCEALSFDDDFLVDGVEPRIAEYLLTVARRNPSIRPMLARATIARSSTAPRSVPTKPSTVYFIRRGSRGPVKIGCAVDPRVRLSQLQTACAEPLSIIGTCAGDVHEEHRLHVKFARYRIRGEWFRPVPSILAAAKGMS